MQALENKIKKIKNIKQNKQKLVNLGENLSFKPFNHDEFDMLDESLEEFISPRSSTKALKQEDASIDNHDNHSCSSPNTSPICDKGIVARMKVLLLMSTGQFFITWSLLSLNSWMQLFHQTSSYFFYRGGKIVSHCKKNSNKNIFPRY